MTNNLELELIEMNDTIHEGFLDKINGNMEKLDSKYGELVNLFFEKTGQNTLEDVVTYLDNIEENIISSQPDLIPENIVSGATILGVNGTAKKQTVINVTLTGNATYMGYISGYGAGIDQNGNLIIWAMSNTTSYEAIYFTATSVIGTKGAGWDISSHDTSNQANEPRACVLTEINGYDEINITLNASSTNSSYDYVKLDVTVTGV